MDGQGSANWSAYTSAYQDLADLCLRGGLNAVLEGLVYRVLERVEFLATAKRS
jgi:hypothetical protein